jgi:hypothetical protein
MLAQSGMLGNKIAECLANGLGCYFYDRLLSGVGAEWRGNQNFDWHIIPS